MSSRATPVPSRPTPVSSRPTPVPSRPTPLSSRAKARDLLLALLILTACSRPVTDDVTVQFFDDDSDVVVTAETKFDTNAQSRRVRDARAAALNGTDPWSIRFARLSPESESVTHERTHGELSRVTRRIRIPADDLQRVFSDTSITFNLIRGDGWNELTLIPGSSSRATREQQRHFEGQLTAWSHDVARYFTAVDHLYDYLDDNPHRARPVFAALLNEKNALVSEDDEPFVKAVIAAMERIAERMDETEGSAFTLAEEADLVYNPFPARMTIRVPREKDLVIEPVDLFKAVTALEGRWISPDPLALLLDEKNPSSADLASMRRTSKPVLGGGEIAEAIREQLARPKTYSIRWLD